MRASGSSPLTRGKRFAPIALTEWTGLIPAHAGKTSFGEVPGPAWGAHPRSRGENIIEAADPISPLGSSPLTRGKPGPVAPDVRQSRAHPRSRGENGRGLLGSDELHGSSPLTRGKLREDLSAQRDVLAHPRSRGENLIAPEMTLTRAGSSPLTRGKRPEGEQAEKQGRLIPAHAGKTT